MSKSYQEYTITKFDAENWWNFLMREYPKNYDCACKYYASNLSLTKDDDDGIKINDYFESHDLPRITALDGIIKVDHQPVERYGGFEKWKEKRIEFEKLKETPLFYKWKREQYKCQYNRCAWCKKYLFSDNVEIHVDHVEPLIYEGTNDFNNLVLTCADCNYHKGTKTEGYNTGMNDRVNNSVPRWIKTNRYNTYDLPDLEVTAKDIEDFDEKNKLKKYRQNRTIVRTNYSYDYGAIPF